MVTNPFTNTTLHHAHQKFTDLESSQVTSPAPISYCHLFPSLPPPRNPQANGNRTQKATIILTIIFSVFGFFGICISIGSIIWLFNERAEKEELRRIKNGEDGGLTVIVTPPGSEDGDDLGEEGGMLGSGKGESFRMGGLRGMGRGKGKRMEMGGGMRKERKERNGKIIRGE